MHPTKTLNRRWRKRAAQNRERHPMIGWFEPAQLAATGLETVLSSLFGRRADHRAIQALGPAQAPFADHEGRDVLWIDYVADTGDGWNPTYAVARLIGAPELEAQGAPERLPQGQILIMGGDEVYPTPTRDAYEDRLVAPYAAAYPDDGKPGPHLFAIPGNHDWYDGLVGFTNLFCAGSRIGGYDTPQTRSYFAIRLRPGWWLLGIDIQLESDLDNAQIKYFLDLDIQPGDRVVLCTAEPDWIYGNVFAGRKNLGALEGQLSERGALIVMQIAGDLHHYRRHTLKTGGAHLVTAGGGGAFLHPTHTQDVDTLAIGDPGEEREYRIESEYPSRRVSRLLGLRNFAFPLKNPWFGVVPAIVFALLSWVMPMPHTTGDPWADLVATSTAGARTIADSPSSLFWIVVTLLGFVAFTDTHKSLYKWLAGAAHGMMNLGAALAIAMLTRHILHPGGLAPSSGPESIRDRLVLTLAELAGGYLVGSLIMGAYLAISATVFGRHGNDAFSALAIEGYKNFLRMRLDAKGLKVWAIGLDRVPATRQWVWSNEPVPRWELAPGVKLEPRVIDEFEIAAK